MPAYARLCFPPPIATGLLVHCPGNWLLTFTALVEYAINDDRRQTADRKMAVTYIQQDPFYLTQESHDCKAASSQE